jgi:hypothetical protein
MFTGKGYGVVLAFDSLVTSIPMLNFLIKKRRGQDIACKTPNLKCNILKYIVGKC